MGTGNANAVDSQNGHDLKVMLVDNDVVRERWPEIEAAVRDAFAPAEYSDPTKTTEDVLQYIQGGLDGKLRSTLGHALAISAADKVVGAVFCVPTERKPGETSCDIGYIFTSPQVGRRVRLDMLNRLMNLVFDTPALMRIRADYHGHGNRGGREDDRASFLCSRPDAGEVESVGTGAAGGWSGSAQGSRDR